MGLLKSWFQYSMIDALLPLMSKQKPFNTATTKDCRESYRMKILEYKWETVRKRFLNDCLWKASDGELEALEACYWLKATGFASYVKMYEERKFPIDVDMAKKSNNNLDDDSLQSLIKRLETLNKCAKLLQQQSNGISKKSIHHTDFNSVPGEIISEVGSRSYTETKLEHYSESNNTNIETDFKGRTNRSLSCSGTFPVNNNSHKDKNTKNYIDEISSNIVIAINNQYIENIEELESQNRPGFRSSIYDNVPELDGDLQTAMLDRNLPPELKFAINDSFYMTDLTLQDVTQKMQVRRQSSEDDDDDVCSISSQEEEELDEAESLHSLHHLDNPCTIGASKIPGMGSVDSGVPSSPVMRSPSVRKRRVRWHSFQVSCERESMIVSNKIMSLSAGQLNVLKKLSLLRLTAVLERYSCQNRNGWHWTVPKLLKKFKAPDYRDKNIFGVPLLVTAERTGTSLPQAIILALNYLSRLAVDSVGIFRKSGMKSRIDKLRTQMESSPDKVDFDGYSVYDVADTVKQFFRELPEPLLTTKLADTFISIHRDVPKELRLQAMQLAIVLMPDENRDVLQTVLLFLNEVASHAYVNQMSEKNLATCFVPAFFHLCGGSNSKYEKNLSASSAPKKLKRAVSQQCQKELDDTMAAQECLAEMMKCVRFLFSVPDDVMMKSQFSYIEQGDPVALEDLGQHSEDAGVTDSYLSYVDNCLAGLLQEATVNSRSSKKWEIHSETNEVVVSYRKMSDGYPLRLWRAVTEISASPEEILKRIVKERHLWDDEILQWEVVERLDTNTDVFYYETQSIAPSVRRDFVILRSWRTNLSGGSCGLVMTSVKHKQAPPSTGVRGTLLACRCLIEPIGLGRSRMVYIARIDLRGRSSRYYNKAIAPRIMSSGIRKVRDSFNCGPDGPETNV